ncbi:MAG: hypothetical protein HOP16_16315 [Acidobacteria bacterium]|nr:hypothetical protein [Acidobacteriota bacterium]
MADRILESFLTRQQEEGLALTRASDLVSLTPIGSSADRYLIELQCTGLVERGPGDIAEVDRFLVGVWFPSSYLRVADPFRVLTWLGPRNIWHPNISTTTPTICVGRLAPGTGLVDILYQVFEIVTWNKVTMREDDALNRAACQWARRHPDRFPVDRRPLKRRPLALDIADISQGSKSNGHTA